MRKVFDKWLAAARKCGPVTVISQKTRIVFTVRVRFTSVIIRKNWVEAGLWLLRPTKHPQLVRVARYMPDCFYHYFRFEKPADIDAKILPLVRAAYAIGCQEHLKE